MYEIFIAVIHSIIYGIVPFVDKLGFKQIDPVVYSMLKYTVFSLITLVSIFFMFLFDTFNIKTSINKTLNNNIYNIVSKNKNIYLTIVSPFLLFLSGIFLIYTFTLTNEYTYNTVIIITLVLPIIVMLLLNKWVFDEKLNYKVILGILLIIIGLIMITIYNKEEHK